MAVVIWEILVVFRDAAQQITGCETLFVKLDSRDEIGMPVLHQHPCCMAAFLLVLLDSVTKLAVVSKRLPATSTCLLWVQNHRWQVSSGLS